MLADFSAVQALAFACSGDWANAQTAIRRSEDISSLSQGRVLRLFVKAIVAAANDGPNARELFDAALAETIDSGNFDAFVLAYRAYPDILNHVQPQSGAGAALARVLERVDLAIAQRSGFIPPRPRARAHKKLTNREAEVLGLIRQGLSNRQIAATLWLSESTVKLHVHHILDKLGARSRTEAAAVDDA
jgi:ATP/maltotriose-dependent transcriptional regulator MalT